MTDAASAAPDLKTHAWRLFATVLVFALVGPPLGGLAYMETAALTDMASSDGPSAFVMSFVLVAIAVPMTYYFGIVPALAAGLIIGVRQVFYGPMSWPVASAIGIATGMAFYFSMGIPLAQMRREPQVMLWCVMASVVPTLVCWRLVRRWSRAPDESVSLKEKAI